MRVSTFTLPGAFGRAENEVARFNLGDLGAEVLEDVAAVADERKSIGAVTEGDGFSILVRFGFGNGREVESAERGGAGDLEGFRYAVRSGAVWSARTMLETESALRFSFSPSLNVPLRTSFTEPSLVKKSLALLKVGKAVFKAGVGQLDYALRGRYMLPSVGGGIFGISPFTLGEEIGTRRHERAAVELNGPLNGREGAG